MIPISEMKIVLSLNKSFENLKQERDSLSIKIKEIEIEMRMNRIAIKAIRDEYANKIKNENDS